MPESADIEAIFLSALERSTPADRTAFLEAACAGDSNRLRRVRELLAAHDRGSGPLDAPAVEGLTTDQPSVADGPGTMIGPYKVREVIGEGGMGTVYLAQQQEPVKRLVALKVIKPGMDTRQVIARFEAERQALALMDHPNIAKVFDGGTTEQGRPYFAMELVRGVPITRYCDENHLSPADRLGLFIQVCQAVQHAHQKGIIHRDLKPTNVLVAPYDGKPVPKVIDFGVAKAVGQPLTDHSLVTGLGAIVGTLEYMSPEQAELNNLDVDSRTDVYSLGVLLYELLTGSTPIQRKRLRAAALTEALRLVREDEPPRPSTRLSTADELPSIAANRGVEPRKLSGLVRGDLDWIVMRALEKDRGRRYETATGLAHDIENFLRDEPVLARPPSAAYRVRKFARRNRVVVVTVTAVATALLLGTAVATWQAVRARIAEQSVAGQRDVAVTNEQRAIASEVVAQQKRQEAIDTQDELRDTLYAAHMNLIPPAWEADNLPRVRELLDAQIPMNGQRDLRGFEWHYWDRLCHAEVNVLRLPEPFADTSIADPTFAQDGVHMAMLVPREKSVELQVWDASAGIRLLALPLPGGRKVYYQALSGDGRRVVTIDMAESRDKEPAPFDVRLRDAATGTEVASVTVPGVGLKESAQISLSRDGSRCATIVGSFNPVRSDPQAAAPAAKLNVWEMATGKAIVSVFLGSVRPGLAISPDGTRVAAVVALNAKGDLKSPHALKVWDIAGKEPRVFTTSSNEPFGEVVFSPDGHRLAATGLPVGGDCIWVWDVATGREIRAIGGHRAGGSICFSPDGRYLANYTRFGQTLTLWDIATGQPWSLYKGHASGIIGVAFEPGGRQLRTATLDGTLRTWAVPPVEHPRGRRSRQSGLPELL
jgi:serine/threonine protein kinase